MLATVDGEIDVVQDAGIFPAGAVGEADMIEFDGLRERGKEFGVRLFEDVVLDIHEFEDFAGGSEGLLKVVVELGKLADRIVKAEYRRDKRDENARRHLAVLDLLAS